MQCHTIKIAQKLSIYNRFENGSSKCCVIVEVAQADSQAVDMHDGLQLLVVNC